MKHLSLRRISRRKNECSLSTDSNRPGAADSLWYKPAFQPIGHTDQISAPKNLELLPFGHFSGGSHFRYADGSSDQLQNGSSVDRESFEMARKFWVSHVGCGNISPDLALEIFFSGKIQSHK
jgi:hypothetical protein